jgi:hypothetical protein
MNSEGGSEGPDMDIHNFFHRASVAPGEGPCHRDAVTSGEFKHQTIPGLEVGGAEIEWRVRVVAEGVGPCLIQQKIGRGGFEKAWKILLQDFQKLGAVGFRGEFDGKMVWAVMVMSLGNVAVADVVPIVVAVDGEGTSPRATVQKGSGPVTVMEVKIENGGCADRGVLTEIFKGDHEAVECAKAFPVIGAGVMKAAGDSGGNSVGESRASSGQNCAVG